MSFWLRESMEKGKLYNNSSAAHLRGHLSSCSLCLHTVRIYLPNHVWKQNDSIVSTWRNKCASLHLGPSVKLRSTKNLQWSCAHAFRPLFLGHKRYKHFYLFVFFAFTIVGCLLLSLCPFDVVCDGGRTAEWMEQIALADEMQLVGMVGSGRYSLYFASSHRLARFW